MGTNRPLRDMRILLAEDETLIAMYLGRHLGDLGAIVRTVASVEDGLELELSQFDGAVLDVSLLDGVVFPLAGRARGRGRPDRLPYRARHRDARSSPGTTAPWRSPSRRGGTRSRTPSFRWTPMVEADGAVTLEARDGDASADACRERSVARRL